MAKMPGFLRPRPKIDEAEFELARLRTTARLAEIFGVDAASLDDLAHTEVPAETDQPPATDQRPEPGQPRDMDPVVSAKRRGRSRRPIVIELPADPVGVMAEPDEPSVGDLPEPDRANMVGVMAGRGPASAAGPGDEWRISADAYILGRAFGTAPVTVPVRAADAPVRDETGTAGATQPTHDAGTVDVRPEGPVDVEPAVARAPVSDAEPSTRPKAIRRAPEARPRKEVQLRGTRLRPTSAHRATPAKAAPAPPVVAAPCPYCAVLLQPPPTSSRSCPRCRRRIVVKHLDGRAVYLAADAVPVFDAERRRAASSGRWTRERERWLKLAAAAGAPGQRAERLAAALPSEDGVHAARALYMTTVERSFGSAKAEHRWEEASRIRREQALALFRLAGSPVSPPEEIVDLQRDGVVAELHGIAEIAKSAELVSAACCAVCLADAGRTCRISQELSAPGLPHQGCRKGLCRCRWDLTPRDRAALHRHRPRVPSSVRSL